MINGERRSANSYSELEKVLDIVVALNSEKNYYDLLNVVLNKMMELTNADAGTLYVREEELLHFRIMRTVSLNIFQSARDEINLPPIVLDEENIENISAYAAIKNEMISIEDVYEDARFNFSGPKNYDKITGYRTKSMLVFPLSTTEDDVIGVIQLINAMDRETGEIRPFADVCGLSVLLALAHVSANALANIVYAKEIDEQLNSFVRVMTKAIDERSSYSVNHTNNVARFCDAFARYLSKRYPKEHPLYFNDNRRDQLVMAAFLHDIGKIVTPVNIMDKPNRLSDQMQTISFKFELRRHQLETSMLRGDITRDEYKESLAAQQEAIKFIETINNAGFLSDEQIEQIMQLKSFTYADKDGHQQPILTEKNIESLCIRKGTLTAAEREIMQEHVSITGRLLDNMKFNKYYKDVPKWARGHHEFLNGQGYPNNLKNGEISTEMCILTIMDIFDALIANDRPYKKAMPIDRAHAILNTMVDEGKLNAELVKVFIESEIWEEDAEDIPLI